MMDRLEYPVVIAPLSAEDGAGFSALVPDLPGCVSDGDTPVKLAQDALHFAVNFQVRAYLCEGTMVAPCDEFKFVVIEAEAVQQSLYNAFQVEEIEILCGL